MKDVHFLAPRLRPEDVHELETFSRVSATKALALVVVNSVEAYTLAPDPYSDPVGILGVQPSPHAPKWGSVWLLATPAVSRHGIAFLKSCREWRDAWMYDYHGLHCVTLAENRLHVRWLEALGFSIVPAANGLTVYAEYTGEE